MAYWIHAVLYSSELAIRDMKVACRLLRAVKAGKQIINISISINISVSINIISIINAHNLLADRLKFATPTFHCIVVN